MPRGFNNWTYDIVTTFLRENGFTLIHNRGSHFYFSGHKDGKSRMVTVPRHANQPINVKTMKSIVIQSGMESNYWLGKKIK
jgi:predicted RNA binding protein YcfA (HicA-like mRNA interferase family)